MRILTCFAALIAVLAVAMPAAASAQIIGGYLPSAIGHHIRLGDGCTQRLRQWHKLGGTQETLTVACDRTGSSADVTFRWSYHTLAFRDVHLAYEGSKSFAGGVSLRSSPVTSGILIHTVSIHIHIGGHGRLVVHQVLVEGRPKASTG
jgi:hypothetical protein